MIRCGPCLQTIPHLTELQHKYKKDAIFLGVSNENVNTVQNFVNKMGNKMVKEKKNFLYL